MKNDDNTFPFWIWGAYILLFAFSIPWYMPAKVEMKLVLGLPLWLVGCIGVIFFTACFTAWVIHKYWKET